MPIHSLGSVHLEVADLEAWRRFAAGFLGLQEVTGAEPDTLYFRMDQFHHRLAVTRAASPRLRGVCFQVTDARDLERLVAALAAVGVDARHGTKEECGLRHVTGFAAFTDPSGNPVELFYGPRLDHSVVSTPTVSRFVTGDEGMGHVILNVTDVEASLTVYRDALGFLERNTFETPGGTLYFLGCNARQHTLGLAPSAAPGLLHLMVEAGTLDDVGRALDRTVTYDVPMMQSLGRHTNDYMVSFYVWSPENIAVEFGYDGDRVAGLQPTYEITEGAFWGHRFTPPPAR
jgi:3,4-dihydroxy-9,10-secoandrosta-1,3,5(10)-triene-9,17-dione 4,5-dioxygenase